MTKQNTKETIDVVEHVFIIHIWINQTVQWILTVLVGPRKARIKECVHCAVSRCWDIVDKLRQTSREIIPKCCRFKVSHWGSHYCARIDSRHRIRQAGKWQLSSLWVLVAKLFELSEETFETTCDGKPRSVAAAAWNEWVWQQIVIINSSAAKKFTSSDEGLKTRCYRGCVNPALRTTVWGKWPLAEESCLLIGVPVIKCRGDPPTGRFWPLQHFRWGSPDVWRSWLSVHH